MTVAVSKVLDHLFGRLLEDLVDLKEIESISSSIGSIACAYPSIWCDSTKLRLSGLKPSAQQPGWIRMLTHFPFCRPFPEFSDKQLEPLVEHCMTSIYSVDSAVRDAGLVGLKAIASSNLRLVLSKTTFSLKIYSLNNHVVELLDFLCSNTQDPELLKKLLHLIHILFSEEGAVREDLLGNLACCIVPCCLLSQQENLIPLSEILTPMCWRKDLIAANSPALFGLFKAVSALMTVVPPPGGTGTVHAVQSGILRLLVHTKTSEELIKTLESVKILTQHNLLLTSEETCSACIPILIDIGIAIGPLGLLGPTDKTRTVQRALHDVWRCMTPRGTGFILDRASQASQLSTVDRVVTLVYLQWAILGDSVSQQRVDVLVGCIDHLCAITHTDDAPHLSHCVVELIASAAARIPNFLLTVPIIDFIIKIAILKNASEQPSEIKTYLFSSSGGPALGPSLRAVQLRAQQVIIMLAETAGRDSIPAVKERVFDTVVKTLPITGLDALVTTLVRIGESVKDPTILFWTGVHANDPELLKAMTKLVTGASTLNKLQHPAMIEQMFEFALSKQIFEKSDRVVKCWEIARDWLIPVLPDGCGSRTLIQCLQKLDQELVLLEDGRKTSVLGSVIGQLPFAEFTHVMTEMTAYLSKSKNRLIVLMGLKKNSADTVFSILRAGLGFGALHAKLADILPVLHPMFLQPCLETLREIRADPEVLAVQVTLESLVKILPAVSSVICQTDGGEFVNTLITVVLPLTVYQPKPGRDTVIVRLAMETVKVLANVPQLTLSTSNFDLSIQYAVSVLVHGVNSFSTLDTSHYDMRIKTVSDLLVAVLGHSFNVWLGLSRLAQLLHMAGTSSPLPILRVMCIRVYAEVVNKLIGNNVVFDESKSTVLEWIESVVVVVPRLKDPTTDAIAEQIISVLFKARKIESFDVTTVFCDKTIVLDKYVLNLVQLLLHAAATDADHSAAVFALSVLNHIIIQRGQEAISPQDSPGLVSVMLSYAEKQISVQQEFLDCVHAISSVHLSASLTEIISESVTSNSFSDSQQGAIQSIAKEKKLLIGFVSLMTDLMNNSEPGPDGNCSQESVIAGRALEIALNVNDSLLPAMVNRFCASLLGTSLLHVSNTLILPVLRRLNVAVPKNEISREELLGLFVNSAEENVVGALAEFLIPFLARDPRGKACIMNQREQAAKFLAILVGRTDKLKDESTVKKIREVFRSKGSVVGLKQLLVKRRQLFETSDLELIVRILKKGENISECLDLVLLATEPAGRLSGEEDWRKVLLSMGPVLTEIMTRKLVSEDNAENVAIFKQVVTIVNALCDVAAIAKDPAPFFDTVIENLMLELEIRALILEDLGESGDTQITEKTLMKLKKICPQKVYVLADFENILRAHVDPKQVQFASMSCPSRSPLVVKGSAKLAVQIANDVGPGKPGYSDIVMTLLRFIRTQKKSFLYDAAKEHVIRALGDIKLA
jgi:hypothetical protein